MRIVIQGNPIAKARPKFACRGGRAIAYDSQAKLVKSMKSALSINLLKDKDDLEALFSSPISVSLGLYMPIPATSSKQDRNAKLWGFQPPSIKPDIDNLIKWTLDLCNGLLWRDDAQIVSILAYQKYSESPCTIIEVSPIKNYMTNTAITVTKLFSPKELELLNVHLCVLKNSLAQLESCPIDEKCFMLENVSVELIRFANDYAQKLAKLSKKVGNG